MPHDSAASDKVATETDCERDELESKNARIRKLNSIIATKDKHLHDQSEQISLLLRRVEIAEAETSDIPRLEAKLESTSRAQCEAQSQVAALEKEVSMLQKLLADAKADGQQRLAELEAKLAADQLAEALRKLHEELAKPKVEKSIQTEEEAPKQLKPILVIVLPF